MDYCSDPSKQYCPLREYHALPKVSISSREQDGQITEGEAAVFTVTLEETLTSDVDVSYGSARKDSLLVEPINWDDDWWSFRPAA